MDKILFWSIGLLIFFLTSCRNDNFDENKVVIPEFNFPKTIVFRDSLSAYNIFQGNKADLIPAKEFQLLELNSSLFTDYAYKQRLVKLPEGTKMKGLSDNSIDFPNGTILTKTFYYYHDERDQSLGKTIIETRLLIKEKDAWNAATYVWNETQTEAILQLDGTKKRVSWINSLGTTLSTLYQTPTENECMTCHQSNYAMTPLGPTTLNLNRIVDREGTNVNQLSYLHEIGFLESFDLSKTPHMTDYMDSSASIDDRARSYLAINCAHCHNPNAWDIPAKKGFDFSYETSLFNSGILNGRDKISRNMINGEMPMLGTTVLDQEGLALILQYLESL